MTKRRDGDEEGREILPLERLDARAMPAIVRRSFGVPVGVSRLVDLPRAPTDREWEQLVGEFRTTFGVVGVATTSGGIRDWSHGNLHISVEPTEHGEQLRLSTRKDDAVLLNGFGFVLGAFGVLSSAVVAASGKPDKALLVFGMFGGMGLLAFFAATLVRQPLWARQREQQMEAIGEHAVKLLSGSNAKPRV